MLIIIIYPPIGGTESYWKQWVWGCFCGSDIWGSLGSRYKCENAKKDVFTLKQFLISKHSLTVCPFKWFIEKRHGLSVLKGSNGICLDFYCHLSDFLGTMHRLNFFNMFWQKLLLSLEQEIKQCFLWRMHNLQKFLHNRLQSSSCI